MSRIHIDRKEFGKMVKSDVEYYRNDFKQNYKTWITLQKGEWTPEDERRLREECAKIEKQAKLMAWVISGFIYAIMLGVCWLILMMIGVV